MADDEWTWGGILLVIIIIMVIMTISYFLWVWWEISSIAGQIDAAMGGLVDAGETSTIPVDTGGPWYCGYPWQGGMPGLPVGRYNQQGKLEVMLLNPEDRRAWLGCKVVNGKLIVPPYTGNSAVKSQLDHNFHQWNKIATGVKQKRRDN